MARDLESECTTESSSDSSARINICRLRVSNQLMRIRSIKKTVIDSFMSKGKNILLTDSCVNGQGKSFP